MEQASDSSSSSDGIPDDNDAWFTSAHPSHSRSSSVAHSDIISFLSAVQACKLDILPLTWRQGEDPLGRGGTAIVNQTLVDVKTSFAFKRTVKLRSPQDYPASYMSHTLEYDEDQAKAEYTSQEPVYRSLIAELLILRHPSVSRSRNIIDLLAICWEVDEHSRQPWPIFIYPKSNLGDLRSFSKSTQYTEMGHIERLRICTEILEGVAVLHFNNIVHGDIKPENILIFENENSDLVPKLIDFGFSTPAGPDELIYLPKSPPWTAPERTHKGVSILSAKRMDVFSVGLMALWLLSTIQKSEDSWLRQIVQPEEYRITSATENEQNIAPCLRAIGIIEDARVFEHIELERIHSFFFGTLSLAPESRVLQLDILISYLGGESRDSRVDPLVPAGETKSNLCSFNIAECVVELFRSHFRVRKTISQCLKVKAYYHRCATCIDNSAHQLSLCYSIGLGVNRDPDMSLLWQSKSATKQREITAAIEQLKSNLHITIESQQLWELYDKGHLVGLDLANLYQRFENIEFVIKLYEREVSDLSVTLGSTHLLVQDLESRLGDLFLEKGNLQAAERIQKRLKLKKMIKYGIYSPRTWNTCLDLANTYGKQYKWDESARLLDDLVVAMEEANGPDHIETLVAKSYLASVYRGNGNYKQAENMCIKILENIEKTLGHTHIFIFDVKMTLASTYAEQGRWKEAEKAYREAKIGRHEILGSHHSRTMSSQNGLAMMLCEQGQLEDAEKLQSEVVTTLKALYGFRKSKTLTVMSDLAIIFMAQKEYAKAKDLLEQVTQASIVVSGRENRDTIKFRFNLGSVLQAMGKYDGLVETQIEMLEAAKRVLSASEYPTLLTYSMILVRTYYKQGRYSEAEKLAYQILEAAEQRFGVDNLTTIKAMFCLAETLRTQDGPPRWKDTEKIEVRLFAATARTLGSKNLTTVRAMEYLAVTYSEQDRYDEAEDLFKTILQIKQDLLGPTDISTLQTLNLLCGIYCYRGSLEAAEDLATNLSSIAIALFGPDSSFTLNCLSRLASVYHLQDRSEQTKQLLLDAFGLDIELSGPA